MIQLGLQGLRVLGAHLDQVHALLDLVEHALHVRHLGLKVYRALELVEAVHHIHVMFLRGKYQSLISKSLYDNNIVFQSSYSQGMRQNSNIFWRYLTSYTILALLK